MTYAPTRLLEVRHYLQPITGLSDVELGIVGDTARLGGYHHGWDQRVTGDYSWSESTRDSSHKTNASRAVDVGMFPRLRELSVWLAGQCAAGAPDCADIREIIYSPDGKTVKRWDRLGRRTGGDDSHLLHTHIGYFADAEDHDKVPVFRRFFEGADDMTPEQERDLKYAAWRVLALYGLHDTMPGGPEAGEPVPITAAVKQLQRDLAGLSIPAPAPVDIPALAAALRTELVDAAKQAMREVLGELDGK